MKKSKLQDQLTKSLNKIDGAMAGLDAYPSLEDALLDKAQGQINKYLGKIFPTQLDFSIQILEHLVGTDVLIDIISDFLTAALPGVEIAIKAALLANMNNLGSECTIDPFIYEKAIKEGVIFDLKQIDLIDKLRISPLDKKIGQYYYFGVEECESAYDVLQSAINPSTDSSNDKTKQTTSYTKSALTNSAGHYFGERKRDFDCLLWYMKNKAAYREVWGKRTTESEDIFNGGGNIQDWLKKKGSKKTDYYYVNGNNIEFYEYNNGGNWSKSSTTGRIEAVDNTKAYTYLDGDAYYGYVYGNPSIKKVSRKKYYTDKEKVYLYNNNKWDSKSAKGDEYNTIDEVPTSIAQGDVFWINKELYIVTKNPTIKTKNEVKYITSLTYEKCIDVKTDIEKRTCLFVDYDEGDNKANIKSGDIDKVKEAFGTKYADVQKTWGKVKDVSVTQEKNVSPNNLYYVKNGNDAFDMQTSQILITPHKISEGKAVKYVNVNNLMEEKCKYTKDFGVVTLEFSPRTGNVKQSDGDPMHQQTPYDNVLHVFFGNVKELPNATKTKYETQLQETSDINKIGSRLMTIMSSIIENHKKMWKEKQKEWAKEDKKNKTNNSHWTDNFKWKTVLTLYKEIRDGGESINSYLTAKSACFKEFSKLESKLNQIEDILKKYFKQKEYETKDSNGNTTVVKTDKWVLQEEEFDYDEVGNFFEEIKQVLTENDVKFAIGAYAKRASQLMEANENLLYLSAKDVKYPEAKKNYYLKRTLFEFNADYINSLQLFDSKVLAAQLITSLFGGITLGATIGLTTNWKTELIHDTVKNMVEKTIAAQDYIVSDCFFTFTNDAYNGMLRAAELRQAGLYSNHGEENGNNTIDPISMLSGLNSLSSAADQAEQSSIIKGSLLNVSAEVSKDTYTITDSFGVNSNFGIQTSFIETLITNLCTQLVMAVLSPKVYLLILMNLQMFGISTNFDLKSFVQRFYGLISSIVKSIVDKFMEHLNAKILELVEELASKLKTKIGFEQAEMYMRLLKSIFEHLSGILSKLRGSTASWVQDVVGYADILETDSKEVTNEC